MNIILPIISNTLIVLAIILGVFVGIKNEWKLSLAKLILTIGFGIGLYFLNPIIVNLVSELSFVHNLLAESILTVSTLKSCTFALSFFILFAVMSLMIAIIRHRRNEKRVLKAQNGVSTKRAKAINKETEKLMRKEAKRSHKLERKRLTREHKKARIFGALLEVLVAIIAIFVIFIPVKALVKNELKDIPSIESTYTYTPIGQLDKVTDIVNFIIGE